MTTTPPPRIVRFEVLGVAQPQGSTKAFIPAPFLKAGIYRPVVTHDNPKSIDWRRSIAWEAKAAAQADGWFVGAVALDVVFRLPRPKSLSRAVRHHVKKPDLDKLVRCAKDALKGVLYRDDSQVVDLTAAKRYTTAQDLPRAIVTVRDADDPIAEGMLL